MDRSSTFNRRETVHAASSSQSHDKDPEERSQAQIENNPLPSNPTQHSKTKASRRGHVAPLRRAVRAPSSTPRRRETTNPQHHQVRPPRPPPTLKTAELTLSPAPRTFSSLPTLRPGTSAPGAAFSRRLPPVLLQTTTTAETADVVPASSISAHPALAQSQIRCGPRKATNMNRPSRLIRQRRHGFLSRLRSRTGRNTLKRRRTKGRKMLSA